MFKDSQPDGKYLYVKASSIIMVRYFKNIKYVKYSVKGLRG